MSHDKYWLKCLFCNLQDLRHHFSSYKGTASPSTNLLRHMSTRTNTTISTFGPYSNSTTTEHHNQTMQATGETGAAPTTKWISTKTWPSFHYDPLTGTDATTMEATSLPDEVHHHRECSCDTLILPMCCTLDHTSSASHSPDHEAFLIDTSSSRPTSTAVTTPTAVETQTTIVTRVTSVEDASPSALADHVEPIEGAANMTDDATCTRHTLDCKYEIRGEMSGSSQFAMIMFVVLFWLLPLAMAATRVLPPTATLPSDRRIDRLDDRGVAIRGPPLTVGPFKSLETLLPMTHDWTWAPTTSSASVQSTQRSAAICRASAPPKISFLLAVACMLLFLLPATTALSPKNQLVKQRHAELHQRFNTKARRGESSATESLTWVTSQPVEVTTTTQAWEPAPSDFPDVPTSEAGILEELDPTPEASNASSPEFEQKLDCTGGTCITPLSDCPNGDTTYRTCERTSAAGGRAKQSRWTVFASAMLCILFSGILFFAT